MALTITLDFGPNISAADRAVFEMAAGRWSEIIVEDLTPVIVEGALVPGVLIAADVVDIDGSGAILGQAGPTALRPGSLLPATGIMQFDAADLMSLRSQGTLEDVIIHEMGHVLGFGTLWETKGLIDGDRPGDPLYVGPVALDAYRQLGRQPGAPGIPLANTGGPGTFASHWREALFTNELMTGFINRGENPLSVLTVAAMADLGYRVDPAAADAYLVPGMMRRFMNLFARKSPECCASQPEMVVLGDGAAA